MQHQTQSAQRQTVDSPVSHIGEHAVPSGRADDWRSNNNRRQQTGH